MELVVMTRSLSTWTQLRTACEVSMLPACDFFFFSSHHGIEYPCALVRWFSRVGDSPDDHTGMWVVQPDDDESPLPLSTLIVLFVQHISFQFLAENVFRRLFHLQTPRIHL